MERRARVWSLEERGWRREMECSKGRSKGEAVLGTRVFVVRAEEMERRARVWSREERG